jgi:hypothetical protein
MSAKNDAVMLGIGAVAIVALFLFFKKQAAAAVTAVSNVNQGTPYQGYGAVGTLGHAADTLSGGSLSALGSTIGGKLYDWFGGGPSTPGTVPTDANSPPIAPTTLWNPVQAAPSVLPYSYKQQVIDTPALLGTQDLLTPSADGSGSSGSYLDSYGGSLGYGLS